MVARFRPDCRRRVGEQAVAEIAKQVVRLQLEVRDHQIEAAVAIVVAEVGAHAGPGFAVAGDRDAGQQADFAKDATALVVIQEVRHQIVGDEQVRPSVVVVVAEHDPQTFPGSREQTRFPCQIRKGPVSVVPVEDVRKSPVDIGAAIGANPVVAAIHLARAEIDVVGHEQVRIPVPVDVCERTARAHSGRTDASRPCDVREGALSAVSIQHVRALAGHVEINPSVVVIVPGARAHTETLMDEARGGGHVFERAVATVPIESMSGTALRPSGRRAIHRPRGRHPAIRRCRSPGRRPRSPSSRRCVCPDWRRWYEGNRARPVRDVLELRLRPLGGGPGAATLLALERLPRLPRRRDRAPGQGVAAGRVTGLHRVP